MADTLEFGIVGIDPLLDKLKGFPMAMKAKGIRYAGRRAAIIIQKAAVANALRIDDPTTAEQIAKNITVRFSNKTFKSSGNIMFRVGVMGGARQYADTKDNRRKRRSGATYETAGDKSNPGGDTWYWRLIEFGTSEVPARPFMRPAMETSNDPAITEFVTSLNRWMDKNFKNITRKGL